MFNCKVRSWAPAHAQVASQLTASSKPTACVLWIKHSSTAQWAINLENDDLAIESVEDNDEWLNKQQSAVVLTTF